MPEFDRIGRRVLRLAHQRRDRGANLDADRIALGRKVARVGRAVRRDLAGLVLVAVNADFSPVDLYVGKDGSAPGQ